MPPAIDRPAGQPTAQTWTQFYAWLDRRRERAELAGLYYQGERDSFQQAWELVAEQLRQCVAWSRAEDDQ